MTDETEVEVIPEELVQEEMVPRSMLDDMVSKADMQAYIAEQVNIQFANKVQQEKDARDQRHKVEDAVRSEFTNTMKDSPEPWVDLQGYTETKQGLKITLDWNNAFIDHLRDEGMTGVDEDQIVHRWLAMLMQNVATETEENEPKGDFEE